MTYSGVLSVSPLGYVALAAVPYLLPIVDIVVHDLGSKEIRVRFDAFMTDSALTPSSYVLDVAVAGSGVIPSIERVEWYDADHRSVKITLSKALTRTVTYTCQVLNVYSVDGRRFSGVLNEFIANAYDPPKVVGAALSLRGCVDIMFDRPVGQYSGSAMAVLYGESGGPGTPMSLVPWTSDIPENSVRFSFASAPVDAAFYVNFSGIVDWSHNVTNGRVPLELDFPVTGYADLVQARITSAHAISVTGYRFVDTANVRVFFNVPMDAADVTDYFSNWTVTQHGAHVVDDAANTVTSPDPFDQTTLNTILNEIKAKFNAHRVAVGRAHLSPDLVNEVTSPDATDWASSVTLLIELQRKILDHYPLRGVHTYVDRRNAFTYDDTITFFILAAQRAKDVKEGFNGHILEEYPIGFSPAYTIGEISNFATAGGEHFEVEGPRTWFVDLHLQTDVLTEAAQTIVRVTAQSEDGLSVTNPATTGMAHVRMIDTLPSVLERRVENGVLSLRMDRSFNPIGVHRSRVVSASGTPMLVDSIRATASVQGFVWALNDTIFSYAQHINFVQGAVHNTIVAHDLVATSDYATEADVPTLVFKVNALKGKINSHFGRDEYHDGVDRSIVDLPDATTFDEAVLVLDEIRRELIRHNSSGRVPGALNVDPRYQWLHESPGPWYLSAPLYDKVEIDVASMEDGVEHEVSFEARGGWFDGTGGNGFGVYRTFYGRTEFQVIGRDMLPSLASAIPRPAYDPLWIEFGFASDIVETYFSKPMRVDELNSANFPVVGGTIDVRDARWANDRVAAVDVVDMQRVSYTVDAVGLHDEAGNPIF